MKKLTLDLDQIHVISFSPQPADGGRRTVIGLEGTIPLHCTENCFPSPDTPHSLLCDGGVFTWPTCNDYQTCEGYVCPDLAAPPHEPISPI